MKVLFTDIFNPNTLNVFVDASIKKININGIEETIGCPGYVVVACNDNYHLSVLDSGQTILRNSTNNESEISAIKLGMQKILEYRKDYDIINLFSDSKICIFGLREWIFKWIVCQDEGILYGSSGVVSNQEIFKSIIKMIIDNDIYVNLYHQKGHVSTDSKIPNAINVFEVSNNIKCDFRTMKILSMYNDMVDKDTKRYLNLFVSKGLSNEINTRNPYTLHLDKYNVIKKYSKLIGGK